MEMKVKKCKHTPKSIKHNMATMGTGSPSTEQHFSKIDRFGGKSFKAKKAPGDSSPKRV